MNTAPLIALKQIAGNPPTHLYPLQQLMLPYVHLLLVFWLYIWCVTATVLLIRLIREYRAHRARTSKH